MVWWHLAIIVSDFLWGLHPVAMRHIQRDQSLYHLEINEVSFRDLHRHFVVMCVQLVQMDRRNLENKKVENFEFYSLRVLNSKLLLHLISWINVKQKSIGFSW